LTAAVPPTHPNGNTNSANDSGGTKRVLLHTINDIQSHYAMMKQLAMTLLEIGGFEVVSPSCFCFDHLRKMNESFKKWRTYYFIRL
jgi:hypothetical protein